jgi:pyruvate dehydrogenase E2 component (dihydrolipoamide acetyltransferase)
MNPQSKPIVFPLHTAGVEDGTLVRWLVRRGDQVVPGQALAEIETDKVTTELQAEEAGVIDSLLVADGTAAIAVNSTIAMLAPEPGSSSPQLQDSAPDVTSPVRASSVEHQLRVPPSGTSDMRVPRKTAHSTSRLSLARRMVQAKNTIPHYYLSVDCQVDLLIAKQKSTSASLAQKLSLNDFVIAACACALRANPSINVQWSEEALVQLESIDIAIAVAVGDSLLTPVIRNADRKSLLELAIESRELITRSRDGLLTPEEYRGGGFTISNLGMFGISSFAAIINAPQSAILAVGAAERRAIVSDGVVKPATVMTCTLSVDHRTVNGAIAAKFLADVKNSLEEPHTLAARVP